MKRTTIVRSLAAGLLLTGALVAGAQQRPQTPPTPSAPAANGTDTSRARAAATAARPTTGPRPYREVITEKAVTRRGMFNVHEVEGKYYLEIPNKLMGRDILTVTRISKAPGGGQSTGGYAGDDVNQNMIQFEKGPNNKVFIKTVSISERSTDSTEGMYWNVKRSNLQPLAASFDVRAFNRDSSGVIIEVTDYVNGDNEVLFFSGGSKRRFGLGGLLADRSYTLGISTYPTNVEIKTVKTYNRTGAAATGFGAPPTAGPQGAGSGQPITFEMNSSLVLLPETPMRPRYFDDRVGYFTSQAITDYDRNPQGVDVVRFIKRFRLEPKPEDREKYFRGELVEPQKPIIYYIDPTTPKKWVPYLKAGVDDWAVAFEKAGFKNAIMAREAPSPQEDSTWSLDDARNNAIVYKPSDIANASGPSIIDPRSGEIMETHINWYHNVMSLLRNWYMVQTAAVDPGARKMVFDDELMGQLIRFVSSHEVGHTLGLRHNFGSSSTVPVEKLRDKAWVEANGHTPSIMDYARFNYVAQPEDNISRQGLFPRIGDYDKWAIEWGYRILPNTTSAEDELPKLNAWTVDNLKNPRLWWGDGEGNRDDPRSQTEDLSDNAMKASSYGVKNLQRIITQLPAWTKEPNKGYDGLREMYQQVVGQFGRYIGHVSNNIGGIERTPKRVEQPGAVYEYRSKATQKEAMNWLQTQVFRTPTWVIQPQVTKLTGIPPAQTIASLQDRALSNVMSPGTLNKMLRAESEEGNNTYTVTEMMNDLRKGIFSELTTRQPVDVYRRQLQKSFAEKVIGLVTPAPASAAPTAGQIVFGAPAPISKTSDALSIAKAQLRQLQTEIRTALPTVTDAATRAHLADLQDRIRIALEPK